MGDRLRKTINEFIEIFFEDEDIPLLDGYDHAFIGVGRQQYGDSIVIYDGNLYRGGHVAGDSCGCQKIMRLTKQPMSRALKRYKGTIEKGAETMQYHDLNDAHIGTGIMHGKQPLMVYDAEMCIDVLTKQFSEDPREDSDPREDAVEWYGYNTEGTYCGPGTPVLAQTLKSHMNALINPYLAV